MIEARKEIEHGQYERTAGREKFAVCELPAGAEQEGSLERTALPATRDRRRAPDAEPEHQSSLGVDGATWYLVRAVPVVDHPGCRGQSADASHALASRVELIAAVDLAERDGEPPHDVAGLGRGVASQAKTQREAVPGDSGVVVKALAPPVQGHLEGRPIAVVVVRLGPGHVVPSAELPSPGDAHRLFERGDLEWPRPCRIAG